MPSAEMPGTPFLPPTASSAVRNPNPMHEVSRFPDVLAEAGGRRADSVQQICDSSLTLGLVWGLVPATKYPTKAT